jgi:hypothetical protein
MNLYCKDLKSNSKSFEENFDQIHWFKFKKGERVRWGTSDCIIISEPRVKYNTVVYDIRAPWDVEFTDVFENYLEKIV